LGAKPDLEIYKTYGDHDLIQNTYLLMIKENTDAALKLELVWNLQVGTEDVVDSLKNNFVTLDKF
jgi:hypothetical protein